MTCQVFTDTLQLSESIEASRKVADCSLCVAHVQLLKRDETRKLSKNKTTISVFSCNRGSKTGRSFHHLSWACVSGLSFKISV